MRTLSTRATGPRIARKDATQGVTKLISSAGRKSNPVGDSSSPAATAAEVCRGEERGRKEEQEATRESYGAWRAQKATKLPQSKTQGERRGTTAEPRGGVARCWFGKGRGGGGCRLGNPSLSCPSLTPGSGAHEAEARDVAFNRWGSD